MIGKDSSMNGTFLVKLGIIAHPACIEAKTTSANDRPQKNDRPRLESVNPGIS